MMADPSAYVPFFAPSMSRYGTLPPVLVILVASPTGMMFGCESQSPLEASDVAAVVPAKPSVTLVTELMVIVQVIGFAPLSHTLRPVCESPLAFAKPLKVTCSPPKPPTRSVTLTLLDVESSTLTNSTTLSLTIVVGVVGVIVTPKDAVSLTANTANAPVLGAKTFAVPSLEVHSARMYCSAVVDPEPCSFTAVVSTWLLVEPKPVIAKSKRYPSPVPRFFGPFTVTPCARPYCVLVSNCPRSSFVVYAGLPYLNLILFT